MISGNMSGLRNGQQFTERVNNNFSVFFSQTHYLKKYFWYFEMYYFITYLIIFSPNNIRAMDYLHVCSFT